MQVIVSPAQTFTRPADTTQYASGDLVANSTTAASVAAMQFSCGSYLIRKAKMTKSQHSATSALFRLHLFSTNPCSSAPANGDNGAISLNTALAGYLGAIDFDMSTSPDIYNTAGNVAIGIPLTGSEIFCPLVADVIYGLLEARGTYTPASGEVFTVRLDDLV